MSSKQRPLTLKGLKRKRLISELEERIYRLHHHSFGALTIEMTAARVNLFVEEIEEILSNLEDRHPQLFPVLSRTEYKIYKMYTEDGFTQKQIAAHFKATPSSVQRLITWMRSQNMPGLSLRSRKPRQQRYETWLDSEIAEK